ncbi:AAA family ATPase [Mesorhizobium sp.]|uniref:AAA family ATPase n=1 Tax=Mesorhizobium sp. TaxID=1871066 RepID=UPI000FE34C0A|nr:AAA family ATPase [Mesorhizobium sp.]
MIEVPLADARKRLSGEFQPRGDRATEGKPSAPPLPFRMYRDFGNEARKEWQVADILGVGEFSVFFGEPGSGKSVLMGDLLLHAAANRDWQTRKTRGGLSVYVALERAPLVARRALAFRQRTQLDNLPFALVQGPINFTDRRIARQMLDTIHRIEDASGIGLVMLGIDTISAALCGGDENSPKDLGALVTTIRLIQEGVPNAHIIAAHHQPHDAQRLRGHGVLLGAVDTTVEVNGKDVDHRTAIVRKQNDGMEGEQVCFRLESVTIHQDDDGTATTAPVVVQIEVPHSTTTKARSPSLTPAAKMAFNALCEAVIELGEVPPASNHIPSSTKAVTMEQWRRHCYRRGISSSTEDRARQQAFQRAHQALAAANFIGVWEPYVWLAR